MIMFFGNKSQRCKIPFEYSFQSSPARSLTDISFYFIAFVKDGTRTIKYFCSKHIWNCPGEYTCEQSDQTAVFYSEAAGWKYLSCNHLL